MSVFVKTEISMGMITYLDEEKHEVPLLNSHLPSVSGWDALEVDQRSIDNRDQDKDQLQKSRRQDTLNDGLY